MGMRLMWTSKKLLPSPFGRGAGGEGLGQGQPVASNAALTLTLSRRARGLLHGLHLMLALLLTLLAGCGGGPKPLPVSGIVTLDGQPVAQAGVLFCPREKGPMGTGTTDANGKFELKTTNTPGVLPGEYNVAIIKKEESGPIAFGVIDPRPQKVKWIIPQKYSNPETSSLKAKVGYDQSELYFALSSK